MENLNQFTKSQNFGEINIVNSRKKGSFLEWFIKRIFQTIGFYATNMAVINNNQIDVFVNYNDIKILVQCKQYEKSTPPVKDLIHEWNSKRMDIECDKALLVLWGYPKIEENESKLAKKLKVYLWNDTLITYFFDLVLSDTNKTKNEILLNLEIDNEETKKILDSIKNNITNRFENFSNKNEELLNLLKDEIYDCYKDGTLIKLKKFEIIWEFLKNKGYFIKLKDIFGDMGIKRKEDCDIKTYEEDDRYTYHSFSDALAKDGRSLIKPKEMFN
jgi:hypothetical protein